jgi:hypothetical protein
MYLQIGTVLLATDANFAAHVLVIWVRALDGTDGTLGTGEGECMDISDPEYFNGRFRKTVSSVQPRPGIRCEFYA